MYERLALVLVPCDVVPLQPRILVSGSRTASAGFSHFSLSFPFFTSFSFWLFLFSLKRAPQLVRVCVGKETRRQFEIATGQTEAREIDQFQSQRSFAALGIRPCAAFCRLAAVQSTLICWALMPPRRLHALGTAMTPGGLRWCRLLARLKSRVCDPRCRCQHIQSLPTELGREQGRRACGAAGLCLCGTSACTDHH